MVTFIMNLRARPSKDMELKQTLLALIEPIQKEKGCLSHDVYEDVENKNGFCLVGQWETRADLDNYRQSDAFAVLMGARSLLDAEPQIMIKEGASA